MAQISELIADVASNGNIIIRCKAYATEVHDDDSSTMSPVEIRAEIPLEGLVRMIETAIRNKNGTSKDGALTLRTNFRRSAMHKDVYLS